ncbi:FAD-dependent oxidoreductase [Pseudoalteromonas luteoviolacea]|uniref:FAD-dependent oxidoreductase n=1 Tax=Pseudoalteromonas luteoviolacea TaxID=43657 RepID=UPI001F3C9FEF|nr:FAD-dependent oxidoreductase [Pseudoalteromonas luteoviolacea]MCF6441881.1 FAD-dependent oxidoreductase [Pseudoalteromonas luteoviolacea]
MINKQPKYANTRVGIIGGGIGGATIALKLSQQGADVLLFEKEISLVNGPPMCHLHAGGNLYREISDQQCIDLLKQSINTAKLYQEAIDYRPTIVAVPSHDKGDPSDVISRLTVLQKEYQRLVASDTQNEILGPASEYFRLYQRADIEKLSQLPVPNHPQTPDEWMIAFAKQTDLTRLKFPIFLVQEYGISVFRLAALTSLALENSPHCELLTSTHVTSVTQNSAQKWMIETTRSGVDEKFEVDYLINACGFRTGTIDDMVGAKPKRMVEFKAAYISRWNDNQAKWPEVIFHGTRGTKDGMTQLTPYPNGYFQIHAMTPDITLFEDGLVSAKQESAQPELPSKYIRKVNHQWDEQVINERTAKAIEKVAGYIPNFNSADIGGRPMYGAQQIPGADATLRVADVAFQSNSYARCEIVKASSALPAANTIFDKLVELGLLTDDSSQRRRNSFVDTSMTSDITEQQIAQRAEYLAQERGFPADLAGRTMPSIT